MKKDRIARAEEQAEIHQIFSNPRRILILWLLESEERSVSDIAEYIGASLQNTSQHLRLMKDKGILITRREGQMIYYRVRDDTVAENCKKILSIINQS
jgi:DNA-binding transcriptional ArsR family regulator